MPKKPRLLLLDAVAVVAAFEVGVWERLVAEYQIVIPSIVADEAHFYVKPPRTGHRYPIDLPAMEATGTIQICEVALGEIATLLARFDASFPGGSTRVRPKHSRTSRDWMRASTSGWSPATKRH